MAKKRTGNGKTQPRHLLALMSRLHGDASAIENLVVAVQKLIEDEAEASDEMEASCYILAKIREHARSVWETTFNPKGQLEGVIAADEKARAA